MPRPDHITLAPSEGHAGGAGPEGGPEASPETGRAGVGQPGDQPDHKAALRARLRSMPHAGAARIEPAALEHLTGLIGRSPRVIMAFAPLPGEPDITPLLHAASACGVHIALPRLHAPDRSMTPVHIDDWAADLVRSPAFAALLEPRDTCPPVPLTDIDLVLVPGLAFDRLGRRLGRGAGYYDRFLTRLRAANPATPARLVGVCDEQHLLPAVPAEAHDVRMDALLLPPARLQPAER